MHKRSTNQLAFMSLFLLIIVACSPIKNRGVNTEILTPENQKDRYLHDIKFISQMPRTPGSKHHQDVQNMCVNRFKKLGFQVQLHDYGSGVNVIGIYPGTQAPKEKILLSAHYDTVPNCHGADDNATGVAAVFETARLLVSKPHHRTLVVACWDEEERITVGSKAFVARARNNGSDIKMSYVYELKFPKILSSHHAK